MELMYTGLGQASGKIKTWSGLEILVRNEHDLFALNEIYILKAYDQKPFIVPRRGVILDIGAHIGTFSLYAAKVCNAKQVYSFEPCPENYEILEMNIKDNHLGNVIKPIPKAIWAQSGKHELQICSENSLFHSFYSNPQQADNVQVECITLKQALEENHIDHVDFLKMDCEGAEWEIINTADKNTMSKIDVIVMEYHFRPRSEFVSLLERLGFDVFYSKDQRRNNSYVTSVRKSINSFK